ncbi:MAG TPA: carboxypeptidase-like regulatory domain-containing protein, partial [Vicinamibacterales bacterium]|nr:carboxypeptidase-like regulatory domain-containing protein [Vicinamibacterales bacterium]
MRRSAEVTLTVRHSLIAVLLLVTPGIAAQLPTRDAAARTSAAGSALVRGRIVEAGTGRPIRGATVAVYANSDRAEHGAITDAGGRYEVRGLTGGRYLLTARADGYLAIEYGQTRPNQRGRPIAVEDGKAIENVDFVLPRGGAIAGTLRDERGLPMVNTQVRVLTSSYAQGRLVLELAASLESALETTNDLGEFRFYGLPPGSLYVAAVPPASAATDNGTIKFAPTYYPGTTSFPEARRIDLKLGETVNNIDLMVLPVRMASISARVVDRDDRPLANATLRVRQVGAGVAAPLSIPRIAPDGTFRLSDLSPEAYELMVTGVSAGPEKTPLGVSAIVRVASGENATNVRLTAVPLTTGNGRVVLDSERPATISQISVTLTSAADTVAYRPGASSNALTRVESDLSFKVSSLPGRYFLSVWELPAGWFPRAVRFNGVDVSDSGIEFPAEGSMAGIELELTNRPSKV